MLTNYNVLLKFIYKKIMNFRRGQLVHELHYHHFRIDYGQKKEMDLVMLYPAILKKDVQLSLLALEFWESGCDKNHMHLAYSVALKEKIVTCSKPNRKFNLHPPSSATFNPQIKMTLMMVVNIQPEA